MIRKFKFEDEIYESLACLPMAARRKLDALGIKIHRAHWEQLGKGERLMICHAPSTTEDERDALKTFIEEAVARIGARPKALGEEDRRAASPPAHPPDRLARNAKAEGIDLQRSWEKLDDDERFALMKLGDKDKPSHNFKPALQEFLS